MDMVNSGTNARTIEIHAGDRFDAMMFGHNKSLRNVVAAWKDGHTEPAREFSVDKDGKRYLLIVPHICGNWAKQVRETPPMAPPETPPASPLLPPTPPLPECKTCPPLQPAYIFPAVPEGTPVTDAAARKFYEHL